MKINYLKNISAAKKIVKHCFDHENALCVVATHSNDNIKKALYKLDCLEIHGGSVLFVPMPTSPERLKGLEPSLAVISEGQDLYKAMLCQLGRRSGIDPKDQELIICRDGQERS